MLWIDAQAQNMQGTIAPCHRYFMPAIRVMPCCCAAVRASAIPATSFVIGQGEHLHALVSRMAYQAAGCHQTVEMVEWLCKSTLIMG